MRARLIPAFLPLFAAAAVWGAPARHPGSLRVCDDVVSPVTLDPRRQFSEKNYTVIRQIFDGLVRFDPDGRIEPALAVTWQRIDPLTVEFKLREGVRFQNGEPVDAEAVRFSIQSLIDPKTAFPGAGFLSSVDKVEVLDPGTVRIKTKFPDGIILNRLASLVTILPPRYIAERGDEYFGSHPIGTGAFKFESWDRTAGRIVFSANEEYWDRQYPKFQSLEFHFVPSEKQVDMLLDGRLDVVTELPGTGTTRVMKSGVARVVKKASFYTSGSSINISSGPLSDKRVRQALNYAIDREALVRYDLLGNGTPLATLTMPGEIGHNPDLKPYPHDLRKARRLLSEAGYPHGLSLRMLVKAQGERSMRIISDQLRKAGIRLDLHLTTDATVIADIQNNPWDLTFGSCSDPMSHSYFVQFIFLSSLSPFSITRDPRYDQLLSRMVGALTSEEQQARGMELDAYVHEEALGLFTYKRIRTYGVRNDIDFVPSVTGMPHFYLTGRSDEKTAL